MAEPIVDRAFAEKSLTAVDRPFDYGVYFLFHDWWAEAPQDAIDAYSAELASTDGIDDFLAERHLAEPIALDDLADCAPGTLGYGYRHFIVDNGLEANLARNYRDFNEHLSSQGTLDRVYADLSYTIVRGFQIHDFLHVITGFSPKPVGELAQAAFHDAQLRFPYHSLRVAVTTAHIAFVKPHTILPAMDAMRRLGHGQRGRKPALHQVGRRVAHAARRTARTCWYRRRPLRDVLNTPERPQS